MRMLLFFRNSGFKYTSNHKSATDCFDFLNLVKIA